MTQTRRNFLKASAAFCVAPLAWLLRKPGVITVNNKPQYEGHIPQDIPAGKDILCVRSQGEWGPVDLESYLVERYSVKYASWLNEQFDSETGLMIST